MLACGWPSVQGLLRTVRTSSPIRAIFSVLVGRVGTDGLVGTGGFGRPWAITVLISIVALAVIVLAVKFSIRRRRPEGEWGHIYRSTDPHSFPSGHAARAVLIAVLAIGLGPGWLAILLCIWAPLVALARVAMGVHYASDILAGGILGVVVGVAALQIHALL